ncbi:MAG: response regulator transcription factor [Pseudonocardia sp.]
MTSILIVDDDPMVSRFMECGLRAAGYSTAVADEAGSASALALSGAFDMVLLDLVLGAGDGFTVLHELRRRRRTLPVLVVTGHPEQRDVVSCLEGGADDYLLKPYRFEELLARVRARLRGRGTADGGSLAAGDLTANLLTRRVVASGEPVELTAREFTLLETFLRHPDQVLSREQLLSRVWGIDFDPCSNVVNVYVAALRQKIGHQRIQTVRGAGYRLRTTAPEPVTAGAWPARDGAAAPS